MAIQTNLDNKDIYPERETEYRLPSGGITYLDKHPDFPSTIVIAPYSFETESILLTNMSSFDKLMRILPRIVVNFPKDFDWSTILLGDATFAFICARSSTYGETFNINSICPACGHSEKNTVSVPTEVPTVNWIRPENKEEADKSKGLFLANSRFFEVKLPIVKDLVRLKFLTMADDARLTKVKKNMSRVVTDGNDSGSIRRVAEHLVSVNGGEVDDIKEAMDYVRRVKGKDMDALKTAISEKAPGIRETLDIQCEKCGHIYPVTPGFTQNFFRRSG